VALDGMHKNIGLWVVYIFFFKEWREGIKDQMADEERDEGWRR
jgi:hypothetical protein